MTAAEAYDLTTGGGAADFARLISLCEASGPYCVIGGLAVNCYVEPVHTLDADIVLPAANLWALSESLFETPLPSHLRIRFTTDHRYQVFAARAVETEVLGVRARVACLEDVALGKLWAWSDPQRSPAERETDESDLVRLARAHPGLKGLYPARLQVQLEAQP